MKLTKEALKRIIKEEIQIMESQIGELILSDDSTLINQGLMLASTLNDDESIKKDAWEVFQKLSRKRNQIKAKLSREADDSWRKTTGYADAEWYANKSEQEVIPQLKRELEQIEKVMQSMIDEVFH